MEDGTQDKLHITLLGLLSNTLVLDATLPYLPLSAIFRLSAVSKSLRCLIYETPRVFRYLDLSRCRGAYRATSVPPVDSEGHMIRCAEVRDENATADEFYGEPLRSVYTMLSVMGVMRDVQTLVLDGVESVTHDVLSDILLSEHCCVQLLSVVGCANLNVGKFQGLLHYLCRASRPEGTPRLKGVYIFLRNKNVAKQQMQIDNVSSFASRRENGITAIPGAQLGGPSTSSTTPSIKPCSPNLNPNPWFSRTGPILGSLNVGQWKTTLRVCAGIIAFDAVLCTHMHAEMAPFRLATMNTDLDGGGALTTPPVATLALGSNGCAGCGRTPLGAPVWGVSDATAFPLVSPPPFSGRLLDAVRPSPTTTSVGQREQRLVVGCISCLRGRYCMSCHRYWCGRCYDPQGRKRAPQLEAQAEHNGSDVENAQQVSEELTKAGEEGEVRSGQVEVGGGTSTSIKIYNDLCTQFCAFSEDLAAGNGAMWG